MKKLIAIFTLISTPALAGSTQMILNSNGEVVGAIRQAGRSEMLFNRNGDFVAGTAPIGNNTAVIDSRGNFAGAFVDPMQGGE